MNDPESPDEYDPILDKVDNPPMYYGFDHKPVTLRQWGKIGRDPRRQVAETFIGADIRVSTVFLGIDHGFGAPGGPVLYETMVFDSGSSLAMDRYRTREAALAGHDQLVTQFQRAADEIAGGLQEMLAFVNQMRSDTDEQT